MCNVGKNGRIGICIAQRIQSCRRLSIVHFQLAAKSATESWIPAKTAIPLASSVRRRCRRTVVAAASHSGRIGNRHVVPPASRGQVGIDSAIAGDDAHSDFAGKIGNWLSRPDYQVCIAAKSATAVTFSVPLPKAGCVVMADGRTIVGGEARQSTCRRFVSRHGQPSEITNLAAFCRERSLHPIRMPQVTNRQRKSHKGWTWRAANEQPAA